MFFVRVLERLWQSGANCVPQAVSKASKSVESVKLVNGEENLRQRDAAANKHLLP